MNHRSHSNIASILYFEGLETAILKDLDTRDYRVKVTAVGPAAMSLPAQIEYDAACAGVPMDLIVLGDESWQVYQSLVVELLTVLTRNATNQCLHHLTAPIYAIDK